MNTLRLLLASLLVLACAVTAENTRQPLDGTWLLKSSVLVPEDGEHISTVGYKPRRWLKTSVPSTVLGALVKNGVYPDLRIGMNSFLIPDSSDEFNRKHDLAKFSYLPDKRNPWRDPYWYRTEFKLPAWPEGRRLWLNFNGINYRAEVWLNGKRIADEKEMAGIYQRFRFDVTGCARRGVNALAVKIHPVDHPGEPDTQLKPSGPARHYFKKEIQKDVSYQVAIGYDCMPPIPDRNMGIWQDVFLEWTGPVDIRDPFVATDLPLPDTSRATLTVSAELVNASASPVRGVLRGRVAGTEVSFEQPVELAPNETKLVRVEPKPVMHQPRLWWPRNYGEQHLYELKLEFAGTERTVAFGVRTVGKELHKLGDHHGLRVLINGQKVFSQGGWLQPELLFEMPPRRLEAEVRYLTEANLNTVTIEDLPVLSDEFLAACDRHGLMLWMSFYSSYWIQPETNWPLDHELLARGGVDVIKRHWNHPSLVLYSCVGEGVPSKDVYLTWRKNLLALDRTRLFVPTVDVRQKVEWLEPDLPTGLHDAVAFWEISPPGYYHRVRNGKKWMFNTEVSIPSLPPVNNLRKFIPDLLTSGGPDTVWAHHDASYFIRDFDPAVRLFYGSHHNIVDYCWKAQLLSAERHRAWSEAANHRMWDITSGIWQWKLNSCWPSVGWQIYDWYLKPMVSSYYYKSAFEPLHVQLNPLDGTVTIINRRLQPASSLDVQAGVYDSHARLRWEQQATTSVGANTYHDVFAVPPLADPTPVYFVKLRLRRDGKPVSENFYWLSAKPYADISTDDSEFRAVGKAADMKPGEGFYSRASTTNTADFSALAQLPPVKLNVSYRIERHGNQRIARVRLHNPTDRLAFFIQLALTHGRQGDEVLPVFWSDNYFSLLPGESKEVDASFAAEDLHGATPVLEVGGWNIESQFKCASLQPSKSRVKAGEAFTIAATITDTFLDGSRVALLVDGQPADAQWTWARGSKRAELTFRLTLREPGAHRLSVADRTIEVDVE
jgi:exo-1,4-beta-D-glucosaminidase